MLHRPTILALLLSLLVQDKTAELDKKEKEAFAAVSTETIRLARFCVTEKAWPDARIVLMEAYAYLTDTKAIDEEVKKLPDKEAAFSKGYLVRYAAERRKADEKRGLALAEYAAKLAAADQAEKLEATLWTIQKHFPSKKAFEKAGAFLFEPYLQWVSKADLARLEAGMEKLDGKWADKSGVEAANRRHASWNSPWIIDDGVHELRSTLPLRDVRRVLGYVTAFRRFELQKFEGLWDLKPPSGKLPVILTATQADLRSQMKIAMGGDEAGESFNGAAYYLYQNRSLNPCFVTLEPTDVSGTVSKITLEGAMLPLRHELTHQICFEYSKYDYDKTRLVNHQFWAVEGVANYMEAFVCEKGDWRLSRPHYLDLGDGKAYADFAWCVDNKEKVPTIEKFVALTKEQFRTIENYHVSATLAWFLYEGEGGKYRPGFVKLLEAVHKVHDGPKTFDECFKGIDLKAMQVHFTKFVDQIQLE